MKNFCKNLKKLATKIVNYEKKEMILLTNKEMVHLMHQETSTIIMEERMAWKFFVKT